ncbi:MAG TPA: hypothetical protein ENI34_02885 [candidate division WOR-3 bacterium]|uniref:Teneurin-like YD-shell domain-containing protein n=1 Tax=candidate division WOR-3 bacterium TaxID=2052148 RepID=A0A9C9JZM6_UNCW3|nr:hypothetical protein [candidate division WOR-3 bacterium]
MRTKVPKKAAWEYCVYLADDEYGIYKKDGTKVSKPFGMAVSRTFGDSGVVQIKISKQLLNNIGAVRYTIATFDPSQPLNTDSLFQGGSSAADVFPGTPATFGGEINGYGEVTLSGSTLTTDYTIYYVYGFGINPVAEFSPDGSILAHYIYSGGLHIARVAGADTLYYHCDGLGSVRVMTNESGTIQWQAWYWPFGEMTKSGFADNTHGFTGKEWDSEMGLNYFCQRYYDPEVGRFMRLDPEDSPASSPYTYCMNNPLMCVDPEGTKFSYLEEEQQRWAMEDWSNWKSSGGGGYTGSTPGFGSWPGSMESWMRAHPAFYAEVLLNEFISMMRFFFAKNDYFRTTTIAGNEQITTEYFFNPITMGIGKITTTEVLSWELAAALKLNAGISDFRLHLIGDVNDAIVWALTKTIDFMAEQGEITGDFKSWSEAYLYYTTSEKEYIYWHLEPGSKEWLEIIQPPNCPFYRLSWAVYLLWNWHRIKK